MQTVADLDFDQEKVEQLKNVYRMVGKRDAGWEFQPQLVPAILFPGLIDLYVEYLRESEGDKKDIEDALQLQAEVVDALLVEEVEEAA